MQPPPSKNGTPERDLAGLRLGDYQVLRRLGSGAMADVYLAEQTSLKRQVAFKVLKPELAGTENYVQRFHNEAQAAASLVHANIVQIHEIDCIDDVHFIAQEYVAGSNLRQYLQRHGRVDLAMGVSIMGQVAAALQRASDQGIVHRDIKPDNIMLGTKGDVKVADFGLARIIQDSSDVELTQVGMTLGTPLYMSPEQAEGQAADHRSDIYSFGISSYHMLAGRPPFEGDTALSVAVQHVKKEPRDLHDLRPDLPLRLCRIIHRMIAKKPDERYQQTGELISELAALDIPGLDKSGWMETVARDVADTVADVRLGVEATQRLRTVMETEALTRRRRSGFGIALTVVAMAIVLGVATAWLTRPADLLQSSGSTNVTDTAGPVKLDTVQEQYLEAALTGKESALKSVAKYFPPQASKLNLYYSRRAEQRLAEIYLERNELGRAKQIYSEFLQAESTEPQFRAVGHAGLANVYHRESDHRQSVQQLKELLMLARQLPQNVRRPIFESLDKPVRDELAKMPQARQLLKFRKRNRPGGPLPPHRRPGG